MSTFIKKLLPMDELFATVRRFPLSVLSAVILFTISTLMVHNVIEDEDEELLGRIIAILGCLYFWFGIAQLIAEGQKLSFSVQSALNFFGGVAIILLIGTSALWWMHLMFLAPALLLGLMIAPYLASGDDTSFWFFNRQMWLGVVLSYAALFLFAGGLSLGFFAIQTLFDVTLPEELLMDIWMFASLILGPVYALSWVPRRLEYTPEDCSDPTELRFIANWISAPMIFIYMAILYAYFGKILIGGEVPNGRLAYMITGFIGAGLVSYLVAWPMRASGSIQLRAFYRVFFAAMVIPVGFHFYAVWERISAYGITESRYVLLLSAVWFASIAIGNVIARMPIKVIPASLCVLMVLASFGPWGAVSVSGYSQFSRLETLLIKHGLLVDGEIVKTQEDIPFEDRVSISSILRYFCHTDRDERLRPLFDFEKNCSARNLTKQLGFDFSQHRFQHTLQLHHLRSVDDDLANFSRYKKSINNVYTDISSYDLFVRNVRLNSSWDRSEEAVKSWQIEKSVANGHVLKFAYDAPELTIRVMFDTLLKRDFTVNLEDYAAQNVSMIQKNDELSPIIYEDDQIAIQIDVHKLSGKMKDKERFVTDMTFDLFYRIKK